MKKILKTILSVILVFGMVLNILPTFADATEVGQFYTILYEDFDQFTGGKSIENGWRFESVPSTSVDFSGEGKAVVIGSGSKAEKAVNDGYTNGKFKLSFEIKTSGTANIFIHNNDNGTAAYSPVLVKNGDVYVNNVKLNQNGDGGELAVRNYSGEWLVCETVFDLDEKNADITLKNQYGDILFEKVFFGLCGYFGETLDKIKEIVFSAESQQLAIDNIKFEKYILSDSELVMFSEDFSGISDFNTFAAQKGWTIGGKKTVSKTASTLRLTNTYLEMPFAASLESGIYKLSYEQMINSSKYALTSMKGSNTVDSAIEAEVGELDGSGNRLRRINSTTSTVGTFSSGAWYIVDCIIDIDKGTVFKTFTHKANGSRYAEFGKLADITASANPVLKLDSLCLNAHGGEAFGGASETAREVYYDNVSFGYYLPNEDDCAVLNETFDDGNATDALGNANSANDLWGTAKTYTLGLIEGGIWKLSFDVLWSGETSALVFLRTDTAENGKITSASTRTAFSWTPFYISGAAGYIQYYQNSGSVNYDNIDTLTQNTWSHWEFLMDLDKKEISYFVQNPYGSKMTAHSQFLEHGGWGEELGNAIRDLRLNAWASSTSVQQNNDGDLIFDNVKFEKFNGSLPGIGSVKVGDANLLLGERPSRGSKNIVIDFGQNVDADEITGKISLASDDGKAVALGDGICRGNTYCVSIKDDLEQNTSYTIVVDASTNNPKFRFSFKTAEDTISVNLSADSFKNLSTDSKGTKEVYLEIDTQSDVTVDAVVIAAYFDKNGKMLYCDTETAAQTPAFTKSKQTLSFKLPDLANIDNIKLFVWNSESRQKAYTKPFMVKVK